MMKKLTCLILGSLFVFPAIPISFQISIHGLTIGFFHVYGSGNRTTKTIPIIGSPSKIDVSFGKLTIKQGNEQSLVVYADDNLHDHLKQVVSAASIQLGAKENIYFSTKNPIEYTLTLQNTPNDLRASGSSSITTQVMKTEQMKLILSGASKIYIPTLQTKRLTVDAGGDSKVHIPTLQTEVLTVDSSGASKVTIDNGSTDNQKITCSGGSSYNAAGLKSASTTVDFSGACKGSANAQHISGKLSGASKLNIHGNPDDVDVNTSRGSCWNFI